LLKKEFSKRSHIWCEIEIRSANRDQGGQLPDKRRIDPSGMKLEGLPRVIAGSIVRAFPPSSLPESFDWADGKCQRNDRFTSCVSTEILPPLSREQPPTAHSSFNTISNLPILGSKRPDKPQLRRVVRCARGATSVLTGHDSAREAIRRVVVNVAWTRLGSVTVTRFEIAGRVVGIGRRIGPDPPIPLLKTVVSRFRLSKL
jgi:hypothetical protein